MDGLAISLFLPLIPAFMLDAFAGIAMTRAMLLASAAATLACASIMMAKAPALPRAPLERTPCYWALAACAASAALFWLLAPLFGYDAFLYHLPIADELFRTGHLPTAITSIYDLPRGYPPLVYLGYGAAWIVEGMREHVTVKLLAAAFNLGLIWLVMRHAGLYAALLLATTPAFVEFAHPAGTDTPLAVFALIWALRARAFLADRDRAHLPIAALALALALWTKYQALTFWAGGLAGIAAVALTDRPGARALVAVHAAALLLFTPLLVRNYMQWGNPVFPAFGHGMDPWTLEHLATNVKAGEGLSRLAGGVLWLGLCIPLWLLILAPKREERFFTATALASTALWALLWVRPASMPGRFLLPSLALASIVAAPALADLPRLTFPLIAAQVAYLAGALGLHVVALQENVTKSAYRLVAFVIRDGHPLLVALAARARRSILVGALILPLAFQCADKLRWVAQKIARHGWVASGSYDPDRIEYAWIAGHLPREARLLAVGGLPDLLPRDVMHVESARFRDALEAPAPRDAHRALAAHGVTHVFVDEVVAAGEPLVRDGAMGKALADPALFERLLAEPGRMSIYKLRP